MHPSDEELIGRFKGGDKQAFVDIYNRYKNRILGYLVRYIGDYYAAEDVTVEAFMKVHDNIGSYREEQKFTDEIGRRKFTDPEAWKKIPR